ncbi:MAG: twin-arginine translocase TatA/TatE family subunit [Bacteroidetes bacterium CG12_big_fil_rev_8_21_14_0_65_60_17]|nr:MAG: twin-arginine translocase TatA/TatE family subunit [Bacteroidetes bacterium CG12_big_fil_rev_8_21_14_0_65_60_17]
MGSLGPFELVLIFLAILLIFGAKRIPEIARGLGKGIKEFKSATREISNEFNVDDSANRIDPPRQASHTTPRQGNKSEQDTPSAQSDSTPNR